VQMGRTQIVVRFEDMASVRGDDAWSLQEGCCGYDSAENVVRCLAMVTVSDTYTHRPTELLT